MGTVFYTVLLAIFYSGQPIEWKGYLFSLWLFIFISEGIFAFNKLIACKHPWHTHTRGRVLFLLSFSIIWFLLAIMMAHYFKPWIESGEPMAPVAYNVSLIIAILFVTIYVVLLFAYNYHQSLSVVMLEVERLQQDKLKQDYRALQDQINPHFLFNNLSTLIAIIRHDKEAAIRFAINFSDVYRYVLESNKHRSIKLIDELKFLKAYGALHQERLKEGLVVEHHFDEEYYNWHLPPLSMQLLLENAVKHNVATKASPLKMKMYTKDGKVVVSNNINAKTTTYSTNTGLSNLRERYKLLTNKEVVIIKNGNEFRVELPLIKQ
ncbi:histidine kinase [Carboxylicivirga mesophila]|uniref:Histidine kinase n=1 Tax=Carboxylicivirga mesophila TaxID=1166478 RepID=A0ABS5KBF7_9BACT|nr:histidine kinase [Carboxylicivirga mesophila]MBS2212284.1 histidine kinase [Carboxylicivirga mesophila]